MVEIADGDKGYRFGFPTYLLAFNKLKNKASGYLNYVPIITLLSKYKSS
jgi:hypothetical protein